jgi:hypothetical protein
MKLDDLGRYLEDIAGSRWGGAHSFYQYSEVTCPNWTRAVQEVAPLGITLRNGMIFSWTECRTMPLYGRAMVTLLWGC